jgi:hypothetical protein
VRLYGDVREVSAAEALGRGLNSAERDGKWNDWSEARLNALGGWIDL